MGALGAESVNNVTDAMSHKSKKAMSKLEGLAKAVPAVRDLKVNALAEMGVRAELEIHGGQEAGERPIGVAKKTSRRLMPRWCVKTPKIPVISSG